MAFTTFDDSKLKRFARDLERFSDRGIVRATQFTLNRGADSVLEEGEKNIRGSMTIRNKFVLGSLRTEKTSSATPIRRQEAVAGSIGEALEVQEFGGRRVSGGRKGIPRTTPRGSGEGDQARPRKRVARPRTSVRGIKLRNTPTSGSRRRKNAQRVGAAVRAGRGKRFAWIDTGSRKGIVQVTGGKRNPKVKLVQDMSRRAVTIPANPWLGPAVVRVKPRMAGIYRKKLKDELRRQGFAIR